MTFPVAKVLSTTKKKTSKRHLLEFMEPSGLDIIHFLYQLYIIYNYMFVYVTCVLLTGGMFTKPKGLP